MKLTRGSAAMLRGFARPAAVLKRTSSPSSRYHMAVRWGDPLGFLVPSTAYRFSSRNVRCQGSSATRRTLAEEISCGRAHVIARGLGGLGESHAAHDRDRAAVELPHHELGGAGDLVGDRDLGDAQLVALGVGLPH